MSDLISRDKAVTAVLGTSIEYQLIYGKKEPKEGFVRSLIKSIANISQEETELIRCKDCKHRPRKDENGRIRPPRVQVGFYDFGSGFEPEYDDDMTCPYICVDCWYTRIPSDEQYCDKAERKEEPDVSEV